MGVHQQCLASYPAAQVPTLEKVLDATSDTSSISYPGGLQANDLIFLLNHATSGGGNAPSDNTATGFTVIDARLVDNPPFGVVGRSKLLYKFATGSESGTITSMINGTTSNRNRLVVFRGSPALDSVSVQNAGGEGTLNNPAGQTIASGSGDAPLLAIAAYAASANVDPRTFSPEADGEFGSGTGWLKWKFYGPGSTPVNHSVDMDDEGVANVLHKCYVELTY